MDWLIKVLACILAGAYSLGLFALGWYLCIKRWSSTSELAAHTGKRCDFPGCYMGLPKNAIRRASDRALRCAEHKTAP